MRFEFLDVFLRSRLRCAVAFLSPPPIPLMPVRLKRHSVIASRVRKGRHPRGSFGQAKYSFGRSVKGGLRAQPSLRKTRPRSERLGRVAQPTALSRRVCPHVRQRLCWSWPVVLWPPEALVRAMSSFDSRWRRPAGGLHQRRRVGWKN
jgi:hypothetical protein